MYVSIFHSEIMFKAWFLYINHITMAHLWTGAEAWRSNFVSRLGRIIHVGERSCTVSGGHTDRFLLIFPDMFVLVIKNTSRSLVGTKTSSHKFLVIHVMYNLWVFFSFAFYIYE